MREGNEATLSYVQIGTDDGKGAGTKRIITCNYGGEWGGNNGTPCRRLADRYKSKVECFELIRYP